MKFNGIVQGLLDNLTDPWFSAAGIILMQHFDGLPHSSVLGACLGVLLAGLLHVALEHIHLGNGLGLCLRVAQGCELDQVLRVLLAHSSNDIKRADAVNGPGHINLRRVRISEVLPHQTLVVAGTYHTVVGSPNEVLDGLRVSPVHQLGQYGLLDVPHIEVVVVGVGHRGDHGRRLFEPLDPRHRLRGLHLVDGLAGVAVPDLDAFVAAARGDAVGPLRVPVHCECTALVRVYARYRLLLAPVPDLHGATVETRTDQVLAVRGERHVAGTLGIALEEVGGVLGDTPVPDAQDSVLAGGDEDVGHRGVPLYTVYYRGVAFEQVFDLAGTGALQVP